MCDVILLYHVSPADAPSITSKVSCKGVIPSVPLALLCFFLPSAPIMCPVRHKKKKERESEKELVPWYLSHIPCKDANNTWLFAFSVLFVG